MISIEHLDFDDKIKLMRELWDNAQPTEMHKKLGFDVKLNNDDLEISVFHYTDNLCGKLIRLDLSKYMVDPSHYNQMYGQNQFQNILDALFDKNKKVIIKEWSYGDENCKCNRYYGTYSKQIKYKDDVYKFIDLCSRCNCKT